MKVTKILFLRLILKLVAFIGMVVAFWFSSLEQSIHKFFYENGTTVVSRTDIVDYHKAPAFTFCFSPSFNKTSNLTNEFFLHDHGKSTVPLWNLFYQSTLGLGRDFDIWFGDKLAMEKLSEGLTTLENGAEIYTYSLPSWEAGMCYAVVPNFGLNVMQRISISFDFPSTSEDIPELTNLYITASNDWSNIAIVERLQNLLIFELVTDNKYSYDFVLEETEFTRLEGTGNPDCDYGCRFEQCLTFDELKPYFKCPKKCLPIVFKGLFQETNKKLDKCQKMTENICMINELVNGIVDMSMADEKGNFRSKDCLVSPRTSKYRGFYRRSLSPQKDKEIKVTFTFGSKEVTIEKEEEYFSFLNFFVNVAGSIGIFFEFCLLPIINSLIDSAMDKLNAKLQPIL